MKENAVESLRRIRVFLRVFLRDLVTREIRDLERVSVTENMKKENSSFLD